MPGDREKRVLVIIPAFNEEHSIGAVIKSLTRYQNENKLDIVVINDGSTDNTERVLKRMNVEVLSHPFNLGVGASFQTGCIVAYKRGYNFVVRMDGDGQHKAEFIDDILRPIVNNEADIAIGSRFLSGVKFKTSAYRRLGIQIISFMLKVAMGKNATDPTSGFCAMNRRAFEFFGQNCVEDYPEPEILLHHKNFRINEVPVLMEARISGTSSITPLRSAYYMIKVLIALFVGSFRKEAR